MASPRAHLSIRARLTTVFVLAVGVVMAFTALAIITLVHRSLEGDSRTKIEAAIAATQARLAITVMPAGEVKLGTRSNIVIQVVNAKDSRVWAASAAIQDAPVLAVPVVDPSRPSGYGILERHSAVADPVLANLSQGVVQPILTTKGSGWIFAWVYGSSPGRSVALLAASVAVSFPLLLLVAGVLIWFGVGFTLAPVEAIRRRVDSIAGRDLSERVPTTQGDDEIARLARTLNAMLDRLEAASRVEQEFVSNASHELRSPLATLLATVGRAQSDPERADWASVADTVMREGRRLDGLIDNLFWLARHDENELQVERVDVDLDDLLFEEAQRVRTISDLAVDISDVSPTRVIGDPSMLKRMVRNVVDNAMRYANSELRLACHYDGDEAVVTVADDGEGVDVDASGRLFERFVRADSARSRRSGGTGLGLAIVTEIAQRHGGRARFLEAARGTIIELRVRTEGPDVAPSP
jgi:signal transduction histidine kinase